MSIRSASEGGGETLTFGKGTLTLNATRVKVPSDSGGVKLNGVTIKTGINTVTANSISITVATDRQGDYALLQGTVTFIPG